jgi:protein-export membrane protein SecD
MGLAVVTLCAVAVDLSGTGGYTLSVWQPVTLRRGLDLGGGMRVLLQARPAPGRTLDDRTMEQERRIIADRLGHGLDLAEPAVRTSTRGHDRYIDAAWADSAADAPAALDLVRRTGRLTIIAIPGIPAGHPPVSKCGEPIHPLVQMRDLTGESARRLTVLADNSDIVPGSVAVGVDTLKGSPVVDAALTPQAAARINAYVAKTHMPYLGIAMDGKIYDVRVSSHLLPLGNQFQLTNTTGSICVTSLTSTTIGLVTTLTYGVLPVPLQVVSVGEIGPSLRLSNADALGLAALVALALGAFVIMARYRLLGALAVAAVLAGALLTLAVVKLVALPLTLAGVAGFALAVVIAADVQSVIVRRACASAREESSEDAADAGAAWAWAVVRDSAAVTLLACALLWWVGTAYAVDVLADFAAVLFIGVVVSTATALVIGPALALLAAGQRGRGATPAPADAPPDRQESVPTAVVPAGG